jgi:hypothetical protein
MVIGSVYQALAGLEWMVFFCTLIVLCATSTAGIKPIICRGQSCYIFLHMCKGGTGMSMLNGLTENLLGGGNLGMLA